MCGLILAPPPTYPCVHDCVYYREGGTKCVLASVGEMLQHRADLYRLATPVHRGQSASSRKYVYKWGSYFYCFHHFTRSTSSHFFSLYLTLLFWNVLVLFLGPSTCFCSLITESVEVFRSFSSTYHLSRSPLGSLGPRFPHCRTLCPWDSSCPHVLFHRNTTFSLLTSNFVLYCFNRGTVWQAYGSFSDVQKGKAIWIAWLCPHWKITMCCQILLY